MLFRLVLLFTIVPLVELALLLMLAERIRWLPTLAIVLGTGILGAALAKWQGIRTIQRIQEELQSGKIPADALLDGLLILISGALLVTPGILTDLTGFLLLIPPVRAVVKRQLRRRMTITTRVNGKQYTWSGSESNSESNVVEGAHDEIIDVQVRGIDQENTPHDRDPSP